MDNKDISKPQNNQEKKITAFELGVNDETKKFFYQVGKVSTTVPWLRPTYNKLKDFLNEIKSTTNIMNEYDLYLMGGVLFDFDTTWDVDMSLNGKINDIKALESDLHKMYDLALNKYNMLVDIQWLSRRPSDLTYKKLEANKFMGEDINFIRLKNIKKIINAKVSETVYAGETVSEYLVKNNLGRSRYKDFIIFKIKCRDFTLVTFSADEFLKTDESYFVTHTNRVIKNLK